MSQLNDWQPELFPSYQPPARPPWWSRYFKTPQRQVVVALAQEDLILAAIGGLMVVVVGFCLGVERGKRLDVVVSGPSSVTTAPVATVLPQQPVVLPAMKIPAAPMVQNIKEMPQKTKMAQAQNVSTRGAYVVQVASFAGPQEAENARRRLTQRGIPASVAEKGKYHVLYAGGYSTYAQAVDAAGQLKSAYRDCFVKKLTTDQRG